MQSEWKKVKIGDICKINANSYSSKDNWEFVNYLDTGNITENKIDSIQNINLKIDKLPSRAKRKVKFNSIIYSTVRPIQKHFGFIKKYPENFLVSTGFAVIDVDENLVNAKFLYYNLIKDEVTQYLQTIAEHTTTAYPSIKPSDIAELEINIPDLETQNKIAKILSLLDDKIELNHKINENLEKQAQAIFKNWFIDFAPFGGTMPRDWKELSLADIADFINGYSYTSSELKESKLAMATIKNFDRNGGFKIDGYKELIPTKKIKTDQYIKLFDIIVAHTDLTQKAEIAGNAEIVLSKSKYEDIICSMDIVKVKPKCNISNFLIMQFLKDSNFKTHCLKYVNGTTVLHLSKKALPEYKICLPSDLSILSPVVNLFSEYYNSIANNTLENERLAELRDTLLPRLMSGEIDVSALKYKI